MAKVDIIKKYGEDLDRIKKEQVQLNELQPTAQIRIDELKPPTAQLDEAIADLTVQINKKIENISVVSIAATNCGCGLTTTIVVPENPLVPLGPTTTITVPAGTTYYYEHAKTLRMNGEDVTYIGPNPFSPLSGTDGSTDFNSGIGSNTTIVGADSNSILEIIVVNGGSGYASSLSPYYSKSLSGGSGSGGIANVIVGTSGTVTDITVSNGGNGYVVGDAVTISDFPGASFRITDVGSPILGVGTQTYIVASSGIGSVFVQDVDTSKISLCLTSCPSYNSQINTLVSELNTLRSQRQVLINGVNNLKNESKRLFLQRYAFCFSRGQLDLRKSEIDGVINVLNDNTYDSYFS